MSVESLGVTFNHLFRYGYAGFLSFLIAAVLDYQWTTSVVGALGPVLTPLTAFAFGGAVYTFYRPLIVDTIVLKLTTWYHKKQASKWGYKQTGGTGSGYTCRFHLLVDQFEVSKKKRINAYRLIRDRYYDPDRAKRFELEHSENHLLYLSFFILLSAGIIIVIYHWLNPSWSPDYDWKNIAIIFGVIAMLCLWLGIKADLNLCRRECAYILSLQSPKRLKVLIRNLLTRAQLI